MEDHESEGSLGKGRANPTAGRLTLQKAIELGEYDPEYLGQFPEWHTLTRHIQFEYIRTALDNRNKQLIRQWAEITNVLDFSQKPHLKEALHNIEAQLEKLKQDKEDLYVKYSVAK
ncbi:MAG TPA: hypothetical protein VG935_04180 [Patescibacteria group bacterium]|nr:hypothetical protein [Patescibacteria group bacterium]